jgi:Hemerythrin HHE cation binding domain
MTEGRHMGHDELPQVLTMEHEAIQEELSRATRTGGKTAQAAWEVTRVLFPHVYREEEFAIPPLLLLPRLARGEFEPGMESMLQKTEVMKSEFPRMLEEHKIIVTALQKLLQAATAERLTGYARLAQKLILHAQTEEEILYPASILVGEFLKLKLGKA